MAGEEFFGTGGGPYVSTPRTNDRNDPNYLWGGSTFSENDARKRQAFAEGVGNDPRSYGYYGPEGSPGGGGGEGGGGIGGAMASLLGGKASTKKPVAPVYKSNFEYGGQQGGAEQAAGQQIHLFNQAGRQAAPTYNQGNSFAARAQQQANLDLLRQQALGQGPSAAQAQLQAGTDANIRSQMAMANSMRGGVGAQAAAQYGALQNAGVAAQQTANQAALLRAQEMQQARSEFGQQASGLRQADLSQAGTAAQIEAQQRALNAQQQQAYMRNAIEIQERQQQAMQNYEQLMSGNYNSAMGYQTQAQLQNAKQEGQYGGQILGGIAGMLGFLSDERVKEHVETTDPKNLREFLSVIQPKTFDYKREVGGERNVTGVMAQDLEKSALGREVVRNVDGVKVVHLGRAVSAVLAALGDTHKRLERLERR